MREVTYGEAVRKPWRRVRRDKMVALIGEDVGPYGQLRYSQGTLGRVR